MTRTTVTLPDLPRTRWELDAEACVCGHKNASHSSRSHENGDFVGIGNGPCGWGNGRGETPCLCRKFSAVVSVEERIAQRRELVRQASDVQVVTELLRWLAQRGRKLVDFPLKDLLEELFVRSPKARTAYAGERTTTPAGERAAVAAALGAVVPDLREVPAVEPRLTAGVMEHVRSHLDAHRYVTYLIDGDGFHWRPFLDAPFTRVVHVDDPDAHDRAWELCALAFLGGHFNAGERDSGLLGSIPAMPRG